MFTDNYRLKIIFYKNGLVADEAEFDWNYVITGYHTYGTLPFSTSSLFVGEYSVEVWVKEIDDSHDYSLFGEIDIINNGLPYYNPITYVCEDWEHPTADNTAPNYWDLQPVNPKIYFKPGDMVCVLPKANSITQNHQWILDMSINKSHWFSNDPVWHDVGVGWTYTSDQPCFPVYDEGVYRAKVKLDVEVGLSYQNIT